MLFNRKIQNYKDNNESKGLSQQEYREIKENKIKLIRVIYNNTINNRLY